MSDEFVAIDLAHRRQSMRVKCVAFVTLAAALINTVRSRFRLAKERMRERIEQDARLREVFGRE